MNKTLIFPAVVFLLVSACSPQTPPPAEPAAVPEPESVFAPEQQGVTDALETGGPVFTVMNGAYEWESIRPFFGFFEEMIRLAVMEGELDMDIHQVDTMIKNFPDYLGLTEIRARGLSTVQLEDGSYRSTHVMQTTANPQGLLWKLQGNAFAVEAELNRLPATTAFMSRTSVDAPMIKDLIRNSLIRFYPESIAEITQMEVQLQAAGFPLEDALKGLKEGVTFALTLNPENIWNLPVPVPGGLQIPETGLVFSVGDEQGSLTHFVVNVLGNEIPPAFQFIPKEQDGIQVYRIATLPLPMTVNFQIANIDNRFVFTTSDALMAELITRKDGTVDSPLTAHLDGIDQTEAHQLALYTPVLAKEVKTLTDRGLDMARQMGDPQMVALGQGYMSMLYGSLPNLAISSTRGDLHISTLLHKKPMMSGDQTGATITTGPMVVGLLAAIAIPSFQKARESAQEASCTNNLRIMEGSKDMFAIENNKATGESISESDLLDYLSEMPTCPQGGTYTLNPIGTSSRCSLHGAL